mgnify:CR=1 FL=1
MGHKYPTKYFEDYDSWRFEVLLNPTGTIVEIDFTETQKSSCITGSEMSIAVEGQSQSQTRETHRACNFSKTKKNNARFRSPGVGALGEGGNDDDPPARAAPLSPFCY